MFRKIKEAIGLNDIQFMFSFLQKDIFLYILGVLLFSGSRLLENVFTGQLYQLVTQITLNSSQIGLSILRVFLMLLALIIILGTGIALRSATTAGADYRLRLQMGKRLQRIPMTQWYKRHSGEWLTILGKEADAAIEVYKSLIPGFFSFAVQIVGGLFILIFVSRELALFSVFAGVLYFGIGLLRMKQNKKYSGEQRQSASFAAARFSDILSGFMVIRIYRHMKDFLLKLHKDNIDDVCKAGQKMAGINMLNSALGALGYTICYSGAFIIGLLLVYNNKLELSAMLAMWPISLGASYSIMALGFYITDMQPTIAAIQRVREVFDMEEETGGTKDDIKEISPLIEFKNVSFSYDCEQDVLQDMSFCINQGERIAFVGESGSGKSTAAKLMMNLYPDYRGEILFGGESIRNYTLKTLRNKFSYVPQTTHLLSDTVFQNIAIVKDGSGSEVVDAAKKSYAHEFIQALPQQYQTETGENGVRLSGGQRQRISIARAFLKDAPVLIFDEITASLDGESERLIYKALENTNRKQTMILITHRLSATAFADRIFVMEKGKITEAGTHDELIKKDGTYTRLWNLQIE